MQKKPFLKLTADNYYSKEANLLYMSASQFKSFKKCEAAALAEVKGEYIRKNTQALLMGSFVDAYISGELEIFKKEHPEIYKKDGSLKSEFLKAESLAERILSDELSKMLLSGRHQVIKTVKIGGVWFKAKFDSLLSDKQVEKICDRFPKVKSLVPFGGGMIVDLKCMKDFEPIWDSEAGEKVGFVNYWGYDIQGAIYQKADKRNAPFCIVAVTKEEEPFIEAMFVPDDELMFCLSEVEEAAPRYARIKAGELEPTACGRCEYCRSRKKIDEIKDYRMVCI